ncbi:indolepyruvate oxidoreductase subunit beta [Alkalibacter rhizosphaerae]|uniref:Indolepyruvate oxidoreductase subunit beta n=1 Tax=Alkalibacter rhizosphaerae TaxID=2815577 RepID=A0A975AIW2_9FIRM|nr:indolepyruvate oxidoreductase subunit beta [Alkalibacter rhizosphaerae]QSX09084.1 indolepyruvate oxidoreductase subunit beta [Alkalibacter rhizosphaerae]
MTVKNILIVGVGGQGTLLTSRILGNLAVDLGYDVKLSEVHGMSQRGGSVVTHVRYGEKVYSPLVEVGQADLILSFEKLEAIRWKHFLSPCGTMLVNTQETDPMSVITGAAEYPEMIIERLEEDCNQVVAIDAVRVAKELGNVRVVNTILLGLLARRMDITKELWMDAIRRTVPPKTIGINLQAFEKGYYYEGEVAS